MAALGPPQPVPLVDGHGGDGGLRARRRLSDPPSRPVRVRDRAVGHHQGQPHAVHGRALPTRRAVAGRGGPRGHRRLRRRGRRPRSPTPGEGWHCRATGSAHHSADRARGSPLAADLRRAAPARALQHHHTMARRARRRRRRGRGPDRRWMATGAARDVVRVVRHRARHCNRSAADPTGRLGRLGWHHAQPVPRHRRDRAVLPARCAAGARAPLPVATAPDALDRLHRALPWCSAVRAAPPLGDRPRVLHAVVGGPARSCRPCHRRVHPVHRRLHRRDRPRRAAVVAEGPDRGRPGARPVPCPDHVSHRAAASVAQRDPGDRRAVHQLVQGHDAGRRSRRVPRGVQRVQSRDSARRVPGPATVRRVARVPHVAVLDRMHHDEPREPEDSSDDWESGRDERRDERHGNCVRRRHPGRGRHDDRARRCHQAIRRVHRARRPST